MTVNEAEPGQPGERLPLGYGRIRRGPMAADAFTQIRNAVFRDVRLSAKAMGIFGNISTHRDGWGVSAESIASQMKDGVAAVKGGLRELEECGYLRRTQVRRPDGTLGGAVYYITDQPDVLPEQPDLPELPQSSRSEPSVENRPAVVTSNDAQNRRSEPSVDYPPADKPPAENRAHKNTNSKHPKSQKTLSPRLPEQTAQKPSVAEERETVASTDKPTTAQLIVRTAGVVSADEETAFISWVRIKHAPAAPAFWRTVERAGDLPELVEAWRASQPMRPRLSLIPDWCGHCNRGTEPTSIAERLTETADGHIEPCRACHPKRRTAA